MKRVIERAQAAGEVRARDVAARLGAKLAEELPQAQVETGAGEIVVTGSGVRFDAALRWPGGLLR